MKRAWNLTRADAVYRHASFSSGLKAAGFDVRSGAPEGRPGDCLLIWNRYGQNHDLANRFESAGGVVLVAENGYLGPGGISPHSLKDRGTYALARGWHNDAGAVRMGQGDRWAALGVDLAPWWADGGHILVCPNRSFGIPDRMMPPDWANDVRRRLEKLTKREVRVRPHPGNSPPRKPLAEDLAGAWAVVIWSSSAGVHALVAGIPVICEAPFWICKPTTYPSFASLERVDPAISADRWRLSALERMAWAQWSIAEIEDGTAFAHLLRPARQAEVAAGA